MMSEKKQKAGKNKTIDIGLEEGKDYLERCIELNEEAELSQVLDRTILGDSFELMKYLPRKFADLLIVDPPYNLDKDFSGKSFKKLSDEEYREYTGKWLEMVMPLLKDDASVYVCCDWESGMVIGPLLKKYLNLRNRITWQREKGRGARTNWKNSMEDIYFATVSAAKYKFNIDDVKMRRRVMAPYRVDGAPKDWEETEDGNFRNTCPSNFWDDISIPYWSMSENTAHPTQKSEKLLAKLILASTDKGDIVLDPFAGSGSTAVTAKKLGRHFVTIEQNPQYCIWAEKRLEMAESDKSIQGYTDGVFWERNTLSLQRKFK